jgi:predicted nucleic acid-binding protein
MPSGKRRATVSDVNARFISAFYHRTFSFDGHAANVYGQLVAHRMSDGRPISREDAQIASSCIASGASLATHNIRDFDAIPGLKLINPWDAD